MMMAPLKIHVVLFDIPAIAHGDILQYIFTQVLGEGNHLPSDDLEFATKTFIPLLVNFAKTRYVYVIQLASRQPTSHRHHTYM